jgi:CheY-like chemotaxis protein
MPAGDRPAADPGELDALRADALTWLAPAISHELANPLAALVAFGGLLAGDPRLHPELQEDVRMLRDEAERTGRLVRIVLELLRERAAVIAPVDVAGVLDELLGLAAPRTADIELVRHVDDPPPVAATDPSRLRQLLLVLFVEALRGLGEPRRGGRLAVSVRSGAAGRVAATLEYRRGSEAVRVASRLPAGERQLPALGGTLLVELDVSGGRLALDLPAAETGAAAPAATGGSTASPARLTVVVCDDEAAIRTLLVRVLERGGIGAIAAADGPAALAAIDGSPVDVVITDHRMAGMSGVELYERAVELRPDLRARFLVMSGEPGSEELRAFTERTGVRLVPKPFDVAGIAALVRDVAREDEPAPQRG